MHTHADQGQAPHTRAVASRDTAPNQSHQTQSVASQAAPLQRQAAPASTNGQPVAQLAWTGGLGGAFGLGALGAFFGGPIGALAGTVIGGAGGHFLQDWWNRPAHPHQPLQQVVAHQAGPPLHEPVDRGSFSANLNHRADFNRELENHVNLGSNYNADYTELTVSQGRLDEAVNALNQREQAQRGYVQQALATNTDLFDNTVGNNANKNQLWQQLLGGVDQGQNEQGENMSDAVKLKTKTSLARMVGTDEGYDLMDRVRAMSGNLNIPLVYEEADPGSGFNLSVTPQWAEDQDDQLQSLKVTVPSNNRYTDGQSFKRVSATQANGQTDVDNLGERISVSPIDTDLFHEFSHALHYLHFEDRRRNGAPGHQQDKANYKSFLGGRHDVMRQQDRVSEARAIHRDQSYTDLSQIIGGMADPLDAQDPFTAASQAMDHVQQATQNAPAENAFRNAIGLSPRQDHRALRLGQDGQYIIESQDYPIVTQ